MAPLFALRGVDPHGFCKAALTIPGVILFSQGDLSYEVDLSHGLIEDLAQSKLQE